MKNNSSFEIPRARLFFGIQNMSKLEDSIITRTPDRQTRKSNALVLDEPKLPYSFLLVSIRQTHGYSLKKPKIRSTLKFII
jgi:hypothetical protein